MVEVLSNDPLEAIVVEGLADCLLGEVQELRNRFFDPHQARNQNLG